MYNKGDYIIILTSIVSNINCLAHSTEYEKVFSSDALYWIMAEEISAISSTMSLIYRVTSSFSSSFNLFRTNINVHEYNVFVT